MPELLIFTGKDWLKTLVEKTGIKSSEIVVDFISIRLSLINICNKYGQKTYLLSNTYRCCFSYCYLFFSKDNKV